MPTDQLQHQGMPLVKAQSSTLRRAVSVRGDTVIKIQEPMASRRERLRTQAGREVGQQTGLFTVPEIVSFDDARGEIVFERLHLTEIRQVLSDRSRSMDLAGRAAQALAAIHRHMKASDEAARIRPDGIAKGQARESVPLHGDFGMRNVFYLSESDSIAVIDWTNADWVGIDADVGAPEIDVAVFLISLFHRRLFGPWPVSRRHEVARHFLSTYASASPHGLDPKKLRAIVAATIPAFSRMVRRRKGSLRALGCRHAMIDLDFFLRRLSHTG
jgi:tRNA A-37 threonylcarbamoyl transferase component Bud32